jgi:hypothetical protein
VIRELSISESKVTYHRESEIDIERVSERVRVSSCHSSSSIKSNSFLISDCNNQSRLQHQLKVGKGKVRQGKGKGKVRSGNTFFLVFQGRYPLICCSNQALSLLHRHRRENRTDEKRDEEN